LVADFEGWLERAGFIQLAVLVDHGIRAGQLPGPHTDPFDRMLIAQAQAENLALVSNEAAFDRYGVRRIW
jgi:PIN domain nuclease of toxin-antitoxin system